MKLLSKIQYKTDEKGEFHDIALRNYEETIAFVLSYPWNTERSLASIELTCPSVTIEHLTGTFLKVGPYFSGKYSVYFLEGNRVYLKIAETLEDACFWIKEYFLGDGWLRGFNRYGFTINAISHFRTHEFEYTVNGKALLKFFWFQIFTVSLVLMLCLITWIDRPESFLMSLMLSFTIFLLPLTGPSVYLFFNYFKVDKYRYLQISKGHDEFKFGTFDEIKVYRKQDVEIIERHKIENGRSPWAECEVYHITFKDGSKIKFSSLLILGSTLKFKFPDNRFKEIDTFFPTM